MGKIDQAIEALKALPPEEAEDIANLVLRVIGTESDDEDTLLTDEQLEELRRRNQLPVAADDPSRLQRVLDEFKALDDSE